MATLPEVQNFLREFIPKLSIEEISNDRH